MVVLTVISNNAIDSLPNIWISIAGASQLILFVIVLVEIRIHVIILAILENLWFLKDGILITSILLVRTCTGCFAREKVFGISFVLFH